MVTMKSCCAEDSPFWMTFPTLLLREQLSGDQPLVRALTQGTDSSSDDGQAFNVYGSTDRSIQQPARSRRQSDVSVTRWVFFFQELK